MRSAVAGRLAAAGRPTGAAGVTPQLLTYSTPGSFSFVTPAGSGYHIDRVVLGAGSRGRNYTFGSSTNGGRAGSFAWGTLVEGVDFVAGETITITVGNGGNQTTAAGGDTTVTAGSSTLTGTGGPSSQISGNTGETVATGNANSGKDVLLNSQTYAGSTGGTSSAMTDPAASPPAPGGGGWGSSSNGVNGRPGGNGRAWLNVYQ